MTLLIVIQLQRAFDFSYEYREARSRSITWMKAQVKFLKQFNTQVNKTENDTNQYLACPPPLVSMYRYPQIKTG